MSQIVRAAARAEVAERRHLTETRRRIAAIKRAIRQIMVVAPVGAPPREAVALAEQLHIAPNCESPSAGTLMNAEQRTTYDKMMAAANRVAQLLWRCDQAERERLLEQAFDDVAEVSRVSGADLDVCRLAVAVQLERLDEGAGHA
jgi:hypothetical protein